MSSKSTLSIIGFGPFGQFIAPHLTPHFEVTVWNRTNRKAETSHLGVQWLPLHECLKKEVVILCTSINYFELFLAENAPYINPTAMVIDVASVKIKPAELMLKYLPATCEIIATHPLFGPQSGKNGIENLNFVLCPIRTSRLNCVINFLSNVLKLNVLIKTPDEHDTQMAYVQALTHFVARVLDAMQIPDTALKTKAYQSLTDTKDYLSGDSLDLFLAIENDNPHAALVRQKFLSCAMELEKQIQAANKKNLKS
ncbi:MAG: prephenate dehydrogenase/arogenate dehydrogenase family protein [Cytophagales bacterium]|nr:prephenate dehydrogenase/arogenate dehydrogenase family protein [Cytophagales bacterium]